jgi:hypothetical protein
VVEHFSQVDCKKTTSPWFLWVCHVFLVVTGWSGGANPEVNGIKNKKQTHWHPVGRQNTCLYTLDMPKVPHHSTLQTTIG